MLVGKLINAVTTDRSFLRSVVLILCSIMCRPVNRTRRVFRRCLCLHKHIASVDGFVSYVALRVFVKTQILAETLAEPTETETQTPADSAHRGTPGVPRLCLTNKILFLLAKNAIDAATFLHIYNHHLYAIGRRVFYQLNLRF